MHSVCLLELFPIFLLFVYVCVVFIIIIIICLYNIPLTFLQFDALWDHVTPCEHLNFCARCRGYDEVISVTFYLDMSLRLQHMKRS